MEENPLQVSTVLGLEIGSINTRAFLFDVVEESYRLIASAVAPSTHIEPVFDIGEAIFEVFSRLQDVTGRVFLDHDANLMVPSQPGGEGIDCLVATTSCVPELKLAIFGLLNEVSIDSARKLANSTYAKIVETVSINDRRPYSSQLDAVIAAQPDLVLFAGGTDNGANRSLQRIAELISTALRVSPRSNRPQVLFCGNPALAEPMQKLFERSTKVYIADNLRPSLQEELLEPAANELNQMILEKTYERIGGLQRIVPLCSVSPRLSNQSFHRVIRFLAQQYDPAKGVLGLDIGATYSIASYANRVTSSLNTFHLGMGEGMVELLQRSKTQEISQWLDQTLSPDEIRDYLWQHSLYPNSLASSPLELSIELAAARQILQIMLRELTLRDAIPSTRFEPIVVSGSVLTRTATPAQSLLAILDGIQPLGITPVILDKHGVAATLGTVAEIAPLLSVQVLQSSAFTNLATVVNINSRARRGATVSEARLVYSDGNTAEVEVKQGSIAVLPLASGSKGQLYLRPVRRTEIEDAGISAEPLQVTGGVCGVVLDARGRPLKLPADEQLRIEHLKEWESLLSHQ